MILTNITKRYDFFEKVLNQEKYFFTVEVIQGETIESIAERIYGSAEYSWLILLSTRSENPFFVNYKSEQEMTDFIKEKYGINLFDVHHYEKIDGTILDDVDVFYYEKSKYSLLYKDVIKITNDYYERRLNEERRIIRIIRPEFLSQIISEIQEIFDV